MQNFMPAHTPFIIMSALSQKETEFDDFTIVCALGGTRYKVQVLYLSSLLLYGTFVFIASYC